MSPADPPVDLKRHWLLDPDVAFLNHGSFGACPIPVLDKQRELRELMEREPVRFFVELLEPMLDDAREAVARFVNADPASLALVTNATDGVNAVLRSLDLRPGDELLTTNHEYNACANALRFAADRSGAKVVVAEVPYPIDHPDDVVAAIDRAITGRTRLAMISHVTSQTALVLPMRQIVEMLDERRIDSLIDGAHAPGMIDLDLRDLGATYYTANCHKWMCAPKGAGFLAVREDRRALVRPTIISHGANSTRTDRSRYHLEFDWTGTRDPTAWLCVPEAIRFMGSLLPGGWPEVRRRNRDLALHARRIVGAALDAGPACPDEMVGSIATVPLPDSDEPPPAGSLYATRLQQHLVREAGVQVPVIPWPAHPQRILRVSAQLYNTPGEYQRLAEALPAILAPD